MPRFMKIKETWPISSISNSLFSASKIELTQVPEGIDPDPRIYDFYESAEEGLVALRSKKEVKVATVRIDEDGRGGATTRASASGSYKGLREVKDVNTGEKSYMIATKEIPGFLIRGEAEILKDIPKLDEASLVRIRVLEIDSKARKSILTKKSVSIQRKST